MTAFWRAVMKLAVMKLAGARARVGILGMTVILLIGAVGVGAIVYYSVPWSPRYAPASKPVYFSTLPPGAKLPSGAECARLVDESPSPENRPANKQFNATVGSPVGPGFLPAGDSPQVKTLVPLINGDFTGTTEDILRWVACKWGIDQDIVFAQAAVESWWDSNELGDWQSDPENCPPGYGLGADGKPGQCPESFGIVQNKYILEEPAWPAFGTSTAMNLDAAYAIWRSCYDGYEVWLNNEPRGEQYKAGDVWGCVGRWFAGSWYTPEADHYIVEVMQDLRDQIWEQPSFRNQLQPSATAG